MKTKKKKIIVIVVCSFLFLIAAAAVWFFQLNPAGYRMSVPCRNSFEKLSDNVYINKGYVGSREDAAALIDQAKDRVAAYFGELRSSGHTLIIICDDDRLLKKLGGDHDTKTVLFPLKRNYISVSDEYLDIDVPAHELTHAELHGRLSVGALSRIPTWFDEGIALQNDYREQYGPEAWAEQTGNGKNTVALADMDEPAEFYAGTAEERRFRYLNAKHEVAEWMEAHGRDGLLKLIDRLNGGEDFESAYN